MEESFPYFEFSQIFLLIHLTIYVDTSLSISIILDQDSLSPTSP